MDPHVMKDATLSRRHFELIAGLIDTLDLGGYAQTDLRRNIAYHFAATLKGTNKSFNMEAFINAALRSDMRRNEKLTKRRSSEIARSAISQEQTDHDPTSPR